MNRSIGKVAVAVSIAIGVGLVGSTPAFGAAGQPPTEKQNQKYFKSLKTVKAPSPCKNDPGITDTEIKVGTLVPLSGPAARIAPALDGFKARIAQANAAGEFGNRKVVFDDFDDKNDNAVNATGAQSLVANDHVFAIFQASGAAGASAQYLYDNGVPVVGSAIGLPAWGTYPNMFNAPSTGAPSPTTFTSVLADSMKKLGAKKVALVTTSTSATTLNINQAAAGVDALPGIEVVYKTTDVPLGTSDWGAYAQNVKNSGADTLYFAGNPTDGVALANAVTQAGGNIKVRLFAGLYDPRVTTIPGLEGAYANAEFIPFEANPPEYNAFKTAIAQVAPGGIPTSISAPGWLAGDLFVQGIKDAGVACPTQKAFINNLRMEKSWDSGGWFKPVSLTESFGKAASCYYLSQIVNKAWTPALEGKPVCATQQLKDNKVVPTTAPVAAPTTTTAAK